MIQPEPEDLPKDNPKLEIAVLRMKKKCMDKGSKERSPPHNLRQKPGQYICCQNHKLIADIENDIMDPVKTVVTVSQSTKVDSLPHIHAHSTKTNDHESSRFKDKDFCKLLFEAFKMRHSMIMLVKDTRSQDGINDKDNDKGSKSRSQSMKEQAYNKEQRERPRPHELKRQKQSHLSHEGVSSMNSLRGRLLASKY
ncbi:hypothetical protein Tco_0991197 [Tanacetum coccineum]|uniref:Uncharacterized protein n=1 Tax=Tanacetum coccineum TaxID=301880 RepID=A0ABQ5EYJ2_9ASTR